MTNCTGQHAALTRGSAHVLQNACKLAAPPTHAFKHCGSVLANAFLDISSMLQHSKIKNVADFIDCFLFFVLLFLLKTI